VTSETKVYNECLKDKKIKPTTAEIARDADDVDLAWTMCTLH